MMHSIPIKDGQYTETIYNLVKESRYEDAIGALSEASASDTQPSRAALSLLGYCYFRTQQHALAAQCYERLVALHPDVPDYKLYLAQALHEAALYDEAAKVVTQAAAAAAAAATSAPPDLQRKLTKLQAGIRYGQGDAPAAKALVDSYAPDDPDRDVHSGCLLYRDGRYEEALLKFSRSLKVLGFDAHLHYNVALCYFRLKEYPQALKHIALVVERGIRDHPELAVGAAPGDAAEVKSVGNTLTLHETALTEAFNLKAAIEFRLRDAEAAREALADMPPRHERELDAVTLHNLALTHHDLHPADAFEKLHFLLQQDPFPPETFANLLLLYCKFEYYDLAADALAENAHFTYEYLTPYLYDFLDATIASQTSPDEAFQKYEEIGSKHTETLRKLTKVVQESRAQGDTERVKRAVLEYEDALERYVPIVMAQARIYWDREDYAEVEKIFRKSVEFCNESDAWRLNVAHVLFMQENKYKEAAGFYEPLVRKRSDDLLGVSAVVLANLCVAYIMTSQNEEAEDIMRRIEKEEERLSFEDPQRKSYHLCIVNLVIGTLYCAKGNYEFGISRVIKSLEPFDKRLGTDTWFYAKRCFLSFLENLAKHLIVIKDSLVRECVAFLEACTAHGRGVSTTAPEGAAGAGGGAGTGAAAGTDEAEARARRTVAYEARLLNYTLYKLRGIDNSVSINKFEDLK